MSSLYDVAVVGAGAAGLSAARELSSAGLRVVIVEARDRLGGRIYTLHPPDLQYPIELGAEFIHGTPKDTWDLLENSGLTAYEIPDTHWLIEGNRVSRVKDFWERIDRALADIDPRSERDFSFRTYLNRSLRMKISRRDRELARAFVEGFNAAPADRISTKSLASSSEFLDALDYPHVFRITQGYDRLLHWIWDETESAACSVILGNPIREIRWERGFVELVSAQPGQETIQARQVIITLPLGVLSAEEGKEGSIRFSPKLGAKTEAASYLAMGPVVKILLRFNHVLWEELGLSHLNFIHTNEETAAFPTWWNAAPVRVPILTGWAGGPAAEKLAGRGEEELRALAIFSLSRMFKIDRSTLNRGVEAFYSYDWLSDPYSRGAYSYICVGGQGASRDLAEPVSETLFFAGEATLVQGLSGTVDGAIATGKRAAREAIRSQERMLKRAA